jgi:AcrR family transcriptional regulator
MDENGGPEHPGEGREELIEAVLALAGEGGYQDLTQQAVIERAGSSSRAFRRHFEDLSDAFGAAYESVATRLTAELLEAGRTGDSWPAGFRSAVEAFLRWVAAESRLARVLLVEYRAAGGRSAEVHEELCERLARAIDTAREQSGAQLDPPPMASSFVLGAIEFAAADKVIRGETDSIGELAGNLAYFGVLAYFGDEAARGELG